MIKSTLIALALVAGSAATAQAQSCDVEPQFAAHRTAHSSVRAQYNAVSRSEWRQAIQFGQVVANSGTTASHKGAAFTNLCIAYASTGEAQRASEACDAAIELRPESWRAYNNRGAANWLAGERDAAISDFRMASQFGAGEDEVQANAILSQCAVAG
jgi:Flp pilus assembly protein TadD